MTCDRCREAHDRGMRFCPWCGEPVRGGMGILASPVRSLMMLCAVVCTILLVMEAYCLYAGAGSTFSFLADYTNGIVIVFPELITVCTISGPLLQAYWVFIVAALTLSFAFLAWDLYRSINSRRDVYVSEAVEHSTLYWVCIAFGVMYILSVLITVLIMVSGGMIEMPDNLPTTNSPNAIFLYAEAAVWEEIVSRVMLIGLPMTVLAALMRKKDCLRYLLGGFGFSKASVILLVFASVFFGLAHMSGWGLEKVLPAAVSGLVLGVLYIKFGVHAAMAVHFMTDYTVVALDATGTVVTFIILAVVVLGAVALVGIAGRVWGTMASIPSMPNILPDQERSGSRRD